MLLLPLALGCAIGLGGETLTIQTEDASEMTVTVTWSTTVPADAWSEFGPDSDYGTKRAAWSSEDGLEHAAVLAGLDSRRTWHWRVDSVGDEGERHSADGRHAGPAQPRRSHRHGDGAGP